MSRSIDLRDDSPNRQDGVFVVSIWREESGKARARIHASVGPAIPFVAVTTVDGISIYLDKWLTLIGAPGKA